VNNELGRATAIGKPWVLAVAFVPFAASLGACERIADPGERPRHSTEFVRPSASPGGVSGRRTRGVVGVASSATTGGSAGAAGASAVPGGSGGRAAGTGGARDDLAGGASGGLGSGGQLPPAGGTNTGFGGASPSSGGASSGGASGGFGSGGELTSLGGTGGVARSGSAGSQSSGGSLATGGAPAEGGQADGGGSNVSAGAASVAGAACVECLPAHCTNGVLESELGELLLDCGGECANNCHCGDRVEPTLGTACYTGLGGDCAPGRVICEASVIRCAPLYGTPEVCDGLDNDCNGEADYPDEDVDDDGDGYVACADTDETDPDVWSSHATCVDRDGDDYYWGCDAYGEHLGPDCNDDDPDPGSCAKNVILFIGDGMGFNHVFAGRCFDNGNSAPLTLETLSEQAQMTTFSASSRVTDSAAAATAMATGRKVLNGVVSVNITGELPLPSSDGSDLPTTLELRMARGQSAGLVTIHDSVVGATPAAFGAHSDSRGDSAEIASDLSTGSRPNLLFGDDTGVSQTGFADAGYTVIETEQALLSLDPASTDLVFGLFPSDVPTLALRTWRALQILGQDRDGFFLMVEQADTDKQSHANNLAGVVDAVIALDAAVQVALAWAAGRKDTLIIVTADHECGGLECDADAAASAGVLPDCSFTSGSHTGDAVPIFAAGVGAGSVVGVLDNTDVFALTAGIGP
jgi:alkaline phosphatase